MLKFFIVGLLFGQNNDCREAYLNKILESNNLAHYFLVVKIRLDSGDREIVVLNYYLYNLMKSRDSSFNQLNRYKGFIKEKISRKEAIEMTQNDLTSIKASLIVEDSNVNATAMKGKDYFLHTYFYVSDKYNYAHLLPKIKVNQITAITKKLFEWNYFIGIVEGNVNILDKDFCNNFSDAGSGR
jgi:hypothetical protein